MVLEFVGILIFNTTKLHSPYPPLTHSLCSDSKAAGVYSQFLHFYDVITITLDWDFMEE